MKTEQVLQKLTNEVFRDSGDHVALKKEDAKLILNRVKHLEGLAAALLRSQRDASTVVLPYQAPPTE